MSSPEPITPEWLERVVARDRESSQRLVERLHPQVLRIVRAHRPRRMAEEDVCQEVFMSLFRHLGQYAGRVPFEHWVSRVAVNTCIDQLRRERARPELRRADLEPAETLALERLAEDGEGPDETVARRDLLGRLMATLGPEDRLLIQWTALEERPVPEVSALTGWSASLVRVKAFRARRRLRALLARLLASESS